MHSKPVKPNKKRPDFDDRKSEESRVDSEQFKSAILTAALDSIVSTDHNGTIVSFNHAAEQTFCYKSADVLGKNLADIIIPPEWRERHRQGAERFFLATGKSLVLNRRIELVAVRADGSTFPVELAVVPLRVRGERMFTAFMRDISERKRAEALQLGQNHILSMVATSEPLQEILGAIARFAESQSDNVLCSIQQFDNDGITPMDMVSPSLPAAFLAQAGRATAGPCQASCGTAVYRGEPAIVTDIASLPLCEACRDAALEHGLWACASWPIFGKHKKILGTLAVYFRNSMVPSEKDRQVFGICANLAGIAIESRATEEKIRYLAHYDGLTSLPNRFLFKEYLDLALRNARRHGNKFAVMFLDLDKFKEINDTLGHDAGDLVLCEIAKRLRSCLRHTDKIARMGGDEFYVLIEELDDSRYAADVARKLLDAAARAIEIAGKDCRLSVSIGIAIYPDDGSDGQALLKNADDAMYRAKDMGKNAFQSFSPLDQQANGLVSQWSAMQAVQCAMLS